jgi:hypothetical protein
MSSRRAEVPAGETAKGTTTYQDLTRLQQVVARRMAESKATAPHFYLQSEIDMSAAVGARARLKATTPDGEIVPSFNDMVVKACALALRSFPYANGAYRDGRLELYSRVNVGVAVAAQDALVVPTVFDADRKGLREIATDTRSLAGKVRDGSITPPELSGGTFTVSNLGMYGVTNFSAVINVPQAAILAVGGRRRRSTANVPSAGAWQVGAGAQVCRCMARRRGRRSGSPRPGRGRPHRLRGDRDNRSFTPVNLAYTQNLATQIGGPNPAVGPRSRNRSNETQDSAVCQTWDLGAPFSCAHAAPRRRAVRSKAADRGRSGRDCRRVR